SPVFLHFEKEKKVIKAGEEFWVDLSGPVTGRLVDILGQARVKIKRKETRSGRAVDEKGAIKDNGQQNLHPSTRLIAKKTKKFFSILEL
ncbi:MAG: hypothetical protein PHS52_05835, partial [Desulfotomaculaceae bacterium]|nr:hypothetical protein [Desulfotomaculaceae bacterium]